MFGSLSIKQIGLAAASIGAVALFAYGKYKIAKGGTKWWVLLVGGLVFAATDAMGTSTSDTVTGTAVSNTIPGTGLATGVPGTLTNS